MSGPFTSRIITTVALGAMLTATCNNKRRGESSTETPPEETRPQTDTAPPPPTEDGQPAHPEPCPAPLATAGPMGPQVAPACQQHWSVPDPEALEALGELADDEIIAGQEPVSPAMGADASEKQVVVGSVILQGPPHCYTLLAACAGEDAAPAVTLHHAGKGGTKIRIPPADEQICPEATGTYNVELGTKQGEARCAVRIWGD